MARYRIEFSRDWIRGRWGFIDRIFHQLGGRETEPSRTENAWLVEFRGNARALGNYITDVLELQPKDFRQFGTIFEITTVAASAKKRKRRPAALPRPRRTGTHHS